jgi:hypothetical protein
VVRLSGAAGAAFCSFCCDSDGDGEPVQIDGVVPGAVAGGSFGLHALNSATEATRGTTAVTTATLRRGLTMARAYPGDDAGLEHAAPTFLDASIAVKVPAPE